MNRSGSDGGPNGRYGTEAGTGSRLCFRCVLALRAGCGGVSSATSAAPLCAEMRSDQAHLNHGETSGRDIAQVIDPLAIVKWSSPESAALLGALRADRDRRHQTGTQGEIDTEARYEHSLRRALSDEFDAPTRRGSHSMSAAMITLASRCKPSRSAPSPLLDVVALRQRFAVGGTPDRVV